MAATTRPPERPPRPAALLVRFDWVERVLHWVNATLFLVLVVTVLSGVYPALVLSGFKPVLVLKNQAFANTAQTRSVWLRKSLTVSQFVIAQVFIIGVLLVSKQINYSINKDLGYKRDAILTFRTNYRADPKKKPVLMVSSSIISTNRLTELTWPSPVFLAMQSTAHGYRS